MGNNRVGFIEGLNVRPKGYKKSYLFFDAEEDTFVNLINLDTV